MKKLLLLSAIMTLSFHGLVDAKTKIGDLYYELDSYWSRAEVTFYSSDREENAAYVSGSLIIPSQVTDGDKEYSVVSISGNAFSDCSGLTNVVIPNSVIRIAGAAFYHCTGLTSIEIPNSVTDIGNAAFYGCTGLKKLTIGENLEIMGGRVFDSCDKLEEVLCSSVIPPAHVAGGYPFSETAYANATLYVPENSLDSYMTTEPWSNFHTIKPLKESGVDAVGMDTSGSPGDIYNLNGQLVKRQASQTDINALTPGIYIIGSKKVLIR